MVARRRAQGTAITAVCSLMGVIGRMAPQLEPGSKAERGSGVGAWSWPEAEMRSFVGGTRAHYPEMGGRATRRRSYQLLPAKEKAAHERRSHHECQGRVIPRHRQGLASPTTGRQPGTPSPATVAEMAPAAGHPHHAAPALHPHCRARRPRPSAIRSSCPRSLRGTCGRHRSTRAVPSPGRSRTATTTPARSRRPSPTPSWRPR